MASEKSIPGPKPLSTAPGLSGNKLLPYLPEIRRNAPIFLHGTAASFGDLVNLSIPTRKVVFINHPDGIKHILQDNNKNYNKNTIQFSSLRKITGNGLLTSDGSFWFRQRRLEQPIFARPRLQALDQVIIPATRKMLARWEQSAANSRSLDVDSEMMQLTLEIVGKALFSIDLSAETAEITRAVMTALDHLVQQMQNPFSPPEWIPTARNRSFRKALELLDGAVYSLIDERQRSGKAGEDMLGVLLNARDDKTGEPMSRVQVRDEILTLLIAGHETVASALTWTWLLLDQNPAVKVELVDHVAGTLQGRTPVSADLGALEPVSRAFSEALRLFPPAWLITRKAIADDTILGYCIPAGTLVILSPYAIHRYAEFWPDPERFDPSRFEPEVEKARPRYAYIPFGGGPRLCIGSGFAQVEAVLIISMVLQRFDLSLASGFTPVMDALVTLRPQGGLPMIPRLL